MNNSSATPRAAIAGPSAAARLWRALAVVGLVALAHGAPILAQWSTQSPLPTHLDVRGVAAPAPGRLFLATDDDSFDSGGALFESNDGGGTWVQREVPASLGDGLNGIFFLDDQHGWVWGNLNYRTTDGGLTWEELPLLGSAYGMEFFSTSFGVATGNFGAYVSRDGGLTWTPSPEAMTAFAFANDLTGLGVAGTGVYRTTDGGDTFALVQAGAADAVEFLSPTVAVAIVDGTLLRSADGGLTWTGSSAAEGRNALLAVAADVALAWGRSGAHPDYDDRIFRSTDGGETWTDLGEVIDPGPLAAGFAFAVPEASIVVASDGAGNLYRSADAGLTWTQTFATPGPVPGFLGSAVPDFTDPLTGYFGFGAGFLLRTADAGASWQQISSGSGTPLKDIDRFANGDLIAVGEGGQVLTSAGGTARWQIRATVSAASLEAVQVIGPQEAVAVDSTGVVYRSTDGGASWAAGVAAPPELAAFDLHFLTGLDGWVIGQGFASGALFHTVDGGASWTPVVDFLGTYVAVDFAGASGWAASYDGTFYRTTDSGLTWTLETLPGLAPQVKDLDFWDASVGYAVGGGGYAARTSDGGGSWQILPTPSVDDQFLDIALVGPDELWVVTAGGRALYSATGGENWAVMDAGPAGFGAFAAITASPAGDAWIAGWQGAIRRVTWPPPPPGPPAPRRHRRSTSRRLPRSPSRPPDCRSSSRIPAATTTARSPPGCGTSTTARPRQNSTRRTSFR